MVASLVAFHQFQPAGVVGIAASAGRGRAEQAAQREHSSREQGNESIKAVRAHEGSERTNERMNERTTNERTCESNRTLHSTTIHSAVALSLHSFSAITLSLPLL